MQYFSDVHRKKYSNIPPTIIPGKAIKIADFGLHSAAAATMWVYTIQQASENPDKLPLLIENINSIDPKFSYPYAFAVLVLPDISKSPDKAIEIAENGIKNSDPDWRIPYYMATTYHIFLKNRDKAVYYFDLAANTPGAPEKIKNISRSYGTASNIREQTKQIWLSIFENTEDELVRKKARDHLLHIEILDALNQAISLYKQKYRKDPADINDLVSGKILKQMPSSPLGSEFYIKDGRVFIR